MSLLSIQRNSVAFQDKDESPFLSGKKTRSSKSIGIECTTQVSLDLVLVLDQLHIAG